jgi:hypothetical protein
MWSRLRRSDPGEPPASVFTEEEEMEEVVYQITSGSRSRISVRLLGRKPIPLDLEYWVHQLESTEGPTKSNQFEPYLSVLGSFNDEESLGNTHGAGRTSARISD